MSETSKNQSAAAESNNEHRSKPTPPPPRWQEIFPGTAWCVDHLLRPEECARLQKAAMAQGIQDLTMEDGGYGGMDLRHRQRVKAVVHDSVVSQQLWERIRHQVPFEFVITEEEARLETTASRLGYLAPMDCIGRWTLSRIVDRFSIAYCTGRGHLAAHRDADHVMDEHERSFLTINGFLTALPAGIGGATRFLKDDITVHHNFSEDDDIDIFFVKDEDVLHRVEADQCGKAVVFFHGLMHDGEPMMVSEEDAPPPAKWIFRTLVYYRRDPSTAPKLTPTEQEARDLVRQAERAEEDGDIPKATQLYRRAYRLDPTLDR